MNNVVFKHPSHALMHGIQRALRLNQRELAEFMGVSSRTIIRYYQHSGSFTVGQYEKAARAVYPYDVQLARTLAAHASKTLVDLGLERPPVIPSPSTALPTGPTKATPSPAHLADSIVCVAAEAMQAAPQATRPAVLAAFERAVALGMTAEDVLAAMTPPPKPAKSKS